ncbi:MULTISPECIES: hypothetical protein [Streptomyces]|uniref:hypothetical protein n=1 Tax=Streptomyces TaxID=1883 RepID=UPI002E26C892|nr:hypothetical protein OG806_42545 [Streptomyces sp. NBC_00882]WSZ62560.1 hypothetical protein OH824_41465 [Streptomyces canus]
MSITRLAALGREEPTLLPLAQRLLTVAESGLPSMLLPGGEAFAFTMAGRPTAAGSWTLEQRGTSTRYAAITALGVRFLPEDRQRAALGGRTAEEFTGLLIESLPGVTNLGDAALIAWAAAETGHPKLSDALARVDALDDEGRPQYTVEAAWVLSALATARDSVDVERRFSAARDRLLRARIGDSPLFPHATGPGLVPWYRAHVACFADQTYPLQALARAHASDGAGDPEALAASEACATRICELQGDGGQWWWHYDARTGHVVEGYPVYSVHQHAMAPTALFDLTDAGGSDFGPAIRKGLGWMTDVPELAGHPEPLILDELGVTWRKVYRGDPKKAVRAARGLGTRVAPGLRLKALDRMYRPLSVDRECRPYEFGWMLHAWQGGRI